MSESSRSAHPHSHPQTPLHPNSINAPKRTPLTNKAASHSTKSFPSGVAWRVNHGFRDVLMRELSGAILNAPSLYTDLFSDRFISDVTGTSLPKLVAVTAPLRHTKGWHDFPEDGDGREERWAAFLNRIADGIATPKNTLRRRWSAAFATQPVKNPDDDSIRKPDLVLLPSANSHSRVSWSDFESFGEEKRSEDARLATDQNCLDKQLMDRAYFVFSKQNSRRFVLALSIAGSFLRLSLFDRAGVLHGRYIDIQDTKNQAEFLRIVIGLAFCNRDEIGYDPTVTVKEGVTYIKAGGVNYRVVDRLFVSDVIRGRGTVVWKAESANSQSARIVTIKDVWADDSRPHFEDYFLRKAREKGVDGVPNLISAETVKYRGGDSNTESHFRGDQYASEPPVDQSNLERRVHRRYVTEGCGTRISEFRSRKELLRVIIDLLKIHQKLVEADILHRDISIRNLMMWHGPGAKSTEETGNTPRRGLLIDFDYATDMPQPQETRSVAHRTGTVPFMAMDILQHDIEHEPHHDVESFVYVLLFLCLEYDGPGQERRLNNKDKPWDIYSTRLAEWIEGESLVKIGESKAADMSSLVAFRTRILEELPPYFADFRRCLEELRKEVNTSRNEDRPLTHRTVIDILEGHLFALPDEPTTRASLPETLETHEVHHAQPEGALTKAEANLGSNPRKRSRPTVEVQVQHAGLRVFTNKSIPPEISYAPPPKRRRSAY